MATVNLLEHFKLECLYISHHSIDCYIVFLPCFLLFHQMIDFIHYHLVFLPCRSYCLINWFISLGFVKLMAPIITSLVSWTMNLHWFLGCWTRIKFLWVEILWLNDFILLCNVKGKIVQFWQWRCSYEGRSKIVIQMLLWTPPFVLIWMLWNVDVSCVRNQQSCVEEKQSCVGFLFPSKSILCIGIFIVRGGLKDGVQLFCTCTIEQQQHRIRSWQHPKQPTSSNTYQCGTGSSYSQSTLSDPRYSSHSPRFPEYQCTGSAQRPYCSYITRCRCSACHRGPDYRKTQSAQW